MRDCAGRGTLKMLESSSVPIHPGYAGSQEIQHKPPSHSDLDVAAQSLRLLGEFDVHNFGECGGNNNEESDLLTLHFDDGNRIRGEGVGEVLSCPGDFGFYWNNLRGLRNRVGFRGGPCTQGDHFGAALYSIRAGKLDVGLLRS